MSTCSRLLGGHFAGAKVVSGLCDLANWSPQSRIYYSLKSSLDRTVPIFFASYRHKARRMGNINATPSHAPAGQSEHEHYRAEAKKHAELRNQYYQQSQVWKMPI